MTNIAILARSDNSGLASQSYNYTRMLKPTKVMLINSKPFNGHEQHPERYEGFNVQNVFGFPTISDINLFIKGVDCVLTAETFYSDYFIGCCRTRGVRTYIAPNMEFSDVFAAALKYNTRGRLFSHPDKYFLPSHWFEEQWMRHFPNSHYLPVPVFASDFQKARNTNWNRRGRRRFVHIVGKQASADRSGYESILDALPFATSDFELVIRCQHDLKPKTDDRRVIYDLRDLPNQSDLYEDADCFVQPRRYGGNNMPMSEALMSGLPVIMTDISPNNSILPQEWLVKSEKVDSLQTRILLDVYGAKPEALAAKLDWLATMPQDELNQMKVAAFELGYDNFSDEMLRPKYEEILV